MMATLAFNELSNVAKINFEIQYQTHLIALFLDYFFDKFEQT